MPSPSARSYTVAAVALALDVTEMTVRRLIATGQLRARRVRSRGGKRGTRWLITAPTLATEGGKF